MAKKILVADDSLTIQKVVELTFADSDYRLTCVPNGRLALEKVREEPPDVILADVVMPEKNGYEVCEEIKRNPATSGIPVVLLAGTFEPFDRDRAQRLGCDAIVSKPFDSRDLYRKVEMLVAGRSGSRASGRTDAAGGFERITAPTAVSPSEPGREAVEAAPASIESPATPSSSPSVPPNLVGAGVAEEDFSGSIRTLRSGQGEPLANLYGPEDVESALAAFREVEPTSRAAGWRSAARPSDSVPVGRITHDSPVRDLDEGGDTGGAAESEPEPAMFSAGTVSDDGQTQRIDVSEFGPPRGQSTVSIARDALDLASEAAPVEDSRASAEPESRVWESSPEEGVLEPLPPVPAEPAPVSAKPSTPASSESSPPASPGATAPRELTDGEIERLAETLTRKLVEKLSDRVVREVAWEVVPEAAELVVRERLRELESGVE